MVLIANIKALYFLAFLVAQVLPHGVTNNVIDLGFHPALDTEIHVVVDCVNVIASLQVLAELNLILVEWTQISRRREVIYGHVIGGRGAL